MPSGIRLCVWLAWAGILAAQPRPKVGLVLEGGGALGLAHLGVLQWLEQNHIPVDAIAGTSMGGLIGGLYAAGKTTDEIGGIIKGVNWDKVLAGQASYHDLSFRRKEDRISYPNRLKFGLKDGLSLPGGLNSGQEVGLLFDRNLLPYYDLASFDDLPIPFRCVATELVSGKEKVFDRGSLSLALRATMSIPAVFAPVRVGDKIYTDGGAVNNLPVNVAKQMGVDIVIAVYLNAGPVDEKSLQSLVGVAGRNISIMVAANEVKSLADADILLSADLAGVATMDFKRADEIIPKGKEAADRKAVLLKRFALNDADWAAYRDAHAARIRREVPVPTFVTAEGGSPTSVKAVEKAFADWKDQPVNIPEIEKAVTKLVGLGTFSSLDYSLIRRNNASGLRIQINEKRYGPPFLDLGVTIDGVDPSDIRFGMSGRLTFMNLGSFGAEWRTDFFFGTNNGITSEFYRPLSKDSKWFVAPRAFATTSLNDLYFKNTRLEQFRYHHSGLGLDVGYAISRFSEIRIGEETGWYSTKLRIGSALLPNESNHAAITAVRYRYEGLDDAIVPRRGFRALSSYQWFSSRPLGDGGYHQLDLKLSEFIPVTSRSSVFFIGNGGTTFGASGLLFQSFSLGGPQMLSAYGRNELLGNQYWLLQAGYIHQIARLNPLFGDAIYGLAAYEAAKVFGNPLLPRLPQSATAALILKSFIGPVILGGSVGDSNHYKLWFGVGRIF